jgi:2-polyprenyl-6-methoxyphenol hydroxylase-like FAD-dependent oxidoreductase
MSTTDVLVVGAGPAGLTTAIAAARNGADVLLVERRRGLSPHPRATGVSTRSMEIFHSWGLDAEIRAGALDAEPCMAITPSLHAPARQVLPLGYPTAVEAGTVSPVAPLCCPQDHIEPVLLAHLRRLGGRVRFAAELTDLTIGDGVRATFADGDPVTARFVVGADGAHSAVRHALGIGVEQLGSVGEFLNVQFRAELGAPRYVLFMIEGSDAREVLLPAGRGRWMYARQVRPDQDPPSRRELVAALRRVTGVPDLDPTITAVQPFAMTGHVATAFRAGPAFLVGDAAHRPTPMGGTGMNTAIHAGHNLGWKLAWVARGRAGDELLDTYAAERRPIGVDNVLRSLGRGNPGTGSIVHDLGVTYGGAEPASAAELSHVRVGGRAPYQRGTTYDGGFTLLAGHPRWRGVTSDVSLNVVDDASVLSGGAALVRPDGHVAAIVSHPAELAAALTALLDRAPSAWRRTA